MKSRCIKIIWEKKETRLTASRILALRLKLLLTKSLKILRELGDVLLLSPQAKMMGRFSDDV